MDVPEDSQTTPHEVQTPVPVQDHAAGHPNRRSGGGSRCADCTLDDYTNNPDGDGLDQLAPAPIPDRWQTLRRPVFLEETFGETRIRASPTTRLSDIFPAAARAPGSSTSTTSGTAGSTRSSSRAASSATPRKPYPVCLEGARACPPEDWEGSGGTRTSSPPSPTPRTSGTTNCGSGRRRKFDPEKFNPAAATRRMKQGLPDWRSMR